MTTGEPAEVVLGTYTIKCEKVPEGYLINDTVVKRLVVTEGQTYDVNVTLQSGSVSQSLHLLRYRPLLHL